MEEELYPTLSNTARALALDGPLEGSKGMSYREHDTAIGAVSRSLGASSLKG